MTTNVKKFCVEKAVTLWRQGWMGGKWGKKLDKNKITPPFIKVILAKALQSFAKLRAIKRGIKTKRECTFSTVKLGH